MLVVKQLDGATYRPKVIWRFDNLRQIYNWCKDHRKFSFNPREIYNKDWCWDTPIFCMTIETDAGIRYSSELIKGMFNKFYKIDKRKRELSWFSGRKRHNGRYYRRPKTIQERRMAVNVLEEEGEPKWRGSRGYHGLPSNWDDIPIHCYKNHNWKRHRKHQWKDK